MNLRPTPSLPPPFFILRRARLYLKRFSLPLSVVRAPVAPRSWPGGLLTVIRVCAVKFLPQRAGGLRPTMELLCFTRPPLEPPVGIEPTTYCLPCSCSTSELGWQRWAGKLSPDARRGRDPDCASGLLGLCALGRIWSQLASFAGGRDPASRALRAHAPAFKSSAQAKQLACSRAMPSGGLEPPSLTAQGPKPCVFASFTTRARQHYS